MAEAANVFEIQIITPDRVFFLGSGSMIEMTTTEGEIGCYPMHVPTTVVLTPGIVTIHDAKISDTVEIPEAIRPDGSLIAAVHTGFAEILNDKVTIMAEVAEWPCEIDKVRAEAAAKRAQERLDAKQEKTDLMRAEQALKKALVREEIAAMEA